MKTSLFKWLTVVFAVMLVSSFVSMMAAFVGSEGADLRDLMILHHTGDPRPWQEHVPAATALFSSIALAACYVSFRLTGH